MQARERTEAAREERGHVRHLGAKQAEHWATHPTSATHLRPARHTTPIPTLIGILETHASSRENTDSERVSRLKGTLQAPGRMGVVGRCHAADRKRLGPPTLCYAVRPQPRRDRRERC